MKNIHLISTKPNDETAKGIWIKETRDWCNICITNDEEIKEGDWMIRGNEQPIKVTKDFFWDFGVRYYKIILTTDQDLIKDGVQSIDDDFLEWFVKNPSCEWVEVDKRELNTDYRSDWKQKFNYKIIIPQEESKQETLEEASERLVPIIIKSTPFGSKYEWIPKKERNSFIQGAKWEQEQNKNKYSEKDMAESFMACWKANVSEGMECKLSFKEWFEQYKK